MHVLLNSDVLWASDLWRGRLPRRMQLLVDACRKQGNVILVPETAQLEFDRSQSELVDQRRAELDAAYATLAKFGITYDHQAADTVISPPDLLGLIAATGVTAEVVSPVLEDFQEAHRRACLHLPPQPPDAKSDEMRDLVIWMIAIRVAQHNGGALLISRDEVHTHHRGDSEADQAQLVRVRSFEEALEYFEVETPAGQLFRRLMVPVWPELERAGLPLSDVPTVLSVSNSLFVQGDDGLASASCTVKVRTTDGKILSANVEIEVSAGRQHATLTKISIDNQVQDGAVSVETDYPQELTANSDNELAELRQVLEDDT